MEKKEEERKKKRGKKGIREEGGGCVHEGEEGDRAVGCSVLLI